MQYHIAFSRPFDLEGIARDAQRGKRPRHVMWGLSKQLGAAIHQPGPDPVVPLDRMRAKIVGIPEHWALARTLSSQLKGDDLIYCTGEDVGIPVATLCGGKRERPKIVLFIHNIDRPRCRIALKLFNLRERINLFVCNNRYQADCLRSYLHLPEDRICIISEQTDTNFFTPGPTSPNKLRMTITSGGLEKRDYRTLAEATQDLDVDVKICAFSPNATVAAQAFPKIMPDNMSCRFYEWAELLQLYRDADLVVVSLVENNYSAGLTTLFESMACRRPVVITRIKGPIEDLANSGVVTGVNPSDPADMRQAIAWLLNNPQEAEAQAQRGYEIVLKQHNSEQYVETLATRLASV